MTDTTESRWALLIHVAEQSLDETTRALARLVAQQDEASRKLQTLLEYRQTYRERRRDAEQGGISADRLRNHQTFTSTLERAIEDQTDRLTAAHRLVAECESAMRDIQRKIHSYGVLRARESAVALTRDRRSEQGRTDELASRMRLAS